MHDPTPSVIAVYDLGSGERRRVAEFRLADGRAVLTLLTPEGCRPAQRWYDDGVELMDEPRRVGPDDGPEFLRALLQPFRMSYYRVVDESPPAAADSR